MAFKFVALFAMLAVASAQHYQNDYYQHHEHQQPHYQHYQAAPAVVKTVQPALIKSYQPAVVKQFVQPALVKKVEYAEAPANYEFNYDVHDHHTGDVKQQHEVAKDGAISGQYSLIDADGYRRIVDYTADDHQGFIANVRREPVEGHKIVKTIQPAVAVQKVIAQPAIAVQKYVAPAPHYQHSYSAPAPQYHQQHYAPAPQYHQQHYAPAPQYHQYQAPAVKVAVAQPVVQKYVAPVVEKYVAPVVQKYVAPAPQYHSYAAPAQVVKTVAQPIKYTGAEHSSHVTFNGPSSNYHY